ncbi:DUF2510 domain-containing protein [Propionicicella superfundia]|uniref:DUF2510 domain-containing protein n=1 Tax=Propionicicella superfundia TaxID=348582 RepID=UPI0004169D8A|nr:DUF2510 domain-containing protein [Propionicicella superfundia]
MASAHRRPGWFRDPEDAGRFRWWSGTGWTAALSDSADAPAPPPGLPEVPPGRNVPWLAVSVLAVALAVFAGLTIVGLAVGPASRGDTVATPVTGTPSTVPPIGAASAEVDEAAHLVTVLGGRLTMPVPGSPWRLDRGLCSDIEGLFASACLYADTAFTRTGSGSSTTVPPVLAAGVLQPSWVGAMPVADAAERLAETWSERAHSAVGGTYTPTGVERVAATGSRAAYEATATVAFDLDGTRHTRRLAARVVEVYPGALAAVVLLTDDLMSDSSRDAAATAVAGVADA